MLRKRLNFAWRIIATGIGFLSFGLGGIGLATVIIPLAVIGRQTPKQRQIRVQNIIHLSFRWFIWLLRTFGVITVDVHNAEALRTCRGSLIVANHPTLIDVVLLISIIPRAQCVVKHQLYDNFFLRGVVRIAGYIRNDLEPLTFINTCQKTFADGNNLIVFPEGTRSIPGQPLRFHRGFANIATLAQVPVQLVIIKCQPLTLNKGVPWYRIPSQPSHYSIIVGQTLEIDQFLVYRSRAIGVRRLVSFLEAYYARKLRHG